MDRDSTLDTLLLRRGWYSPRLRRHLKPILFALLLAIPLAFAPAQAASTSLSVSMDAESYSALAAAQGAAPVATVTLVDSEGAGIAGVEVRVVFLRQVQLLGYVGNETVVGTTSADGTFTATAGTLSGLPGTYVVVARAVGLAAQDRYTVGA